MRWFKHLSTAAEDEKLSLLIEEFGMEGYGIFWRILDIIAQQVTDDSVPSVSYTPKKWTHSLWITCGKLFKFLVFCEEISLFSITFTQFLPKNGELLEESDRKLKKSKKNHSKNHTLTTVEIITISCPNLLKYRDEWASKKARGQYLNSGVTPELLRPKSRTETELEQREREKGNISPSTFSIKKNKKKVCSKFVPDEDDQKLAKKMNVDLTREKQKFIDHFLGTGDAREDWHAVFRNWLRRAGGWTNS